MLGSILAKVGLPVLIRIVSQGLSGIKSHGSEELKSALSYFEKGILDGGINSSELTEARERIRIAAEQEARKDATIIHEINETIRTEIASQDPYVRRMRPTFGYIMAFTWGAQMLAIAVTIIQDPKSAGDVMSGMASLSAIWTVGLSVLGIYVYKRSQEKITGSKRSL